MPNDRIFNPSLLNTVKFVREGYVPQPQYNNIPFDESLFSESFKEWENSSRYACKVQRNDKVTLQVHANCTYDTGVGTGVELYLYNCLTGSMFQPTQGTPNSNVKFQVEKWQLQYAGNTYRVNGVDYQLLTTNLSFNVDDLGIADGRYYIVLKVYYGYQDYDVFISEPIVIAQVHYNTVLLDVSHTRNQYRTYFGGGLRFMMRLEGDVNNLELSSQDTQYNDQDYDMRMLNSYPYRRWTLRIGHVVGVPEWVWDRVHIAMGCKDILIDGVPYTKDEGAEWESTEINNKVWARLPLREPKNYDNSIFVNKGGNVVAYLHESFPYAVFVMHVVINNVSVRVDPFKPIYNQSDLNDFIAWLNNDFGGTFSSTQKFFRGEFRQKGNVIVYENGNNEGYVQGDFTTEILTKVVTMYTVPSPAFYFYHYSFGTVVSWGDGTASGFNPTKNPTLGTSYAQKNNYYGNSIDIFHEDSFNNLQPKFSGSAITGISGRMPVGMVILSIQYSAMNMVNIGDILGNQTSSMTLVEVKNNPNLLVIGGLSGRDWSNITAFNFSNNNLNTLMVDNLLSELWTVGNANPALQSRSIAVWVNQNQPPSSSMTTKINQMLSWGWQIFKD